MFLSDTHLPQLLTRDDYTSPEQLAREMERLFRPGWHLVGTFSDLRRDGDYLTAVLFGHPLIVWRSGGEYHTFLNVCPHRFARLKKEGCGHARERLQCQYHGWEFDCSGQTRKIPDARSFRPMTQGALALTKFRTETCGQLIFVTLDDDAPSLRDYLGPGYEVGATLCGEDRRLAATLDYEIDCNWKCKCENSLESYHVEMVHPTTFRVTPPADACFHELQPGWTTYSTVDEAPSAWDRFLDKLVHRLAGVEQDPEFKHYHYYPHIMFGKMRLFSWIEWTVPLSPERARVVGKFFCHGGRESWRSRLLSRGLASWWRKFAERLKLEDTGVLVEVQQGLDSPRLPSKGVVSIREERCFHFQKYVKEMTADEHASDEEIATVQAARW